MSRHVASAARLARVAFLFLAFASVFEFIQAASASPLRAAPMLEAGALFVAWVLLAAAAGEFVPVQTRDAAPTSAHSDTVDDTST
ncbi:MAG: hypothetical protein ABSB54_09760 [Acidimicrobiales bacterium]|jgi:hypothetical protein